MSERMTIDEYRAEQRKPKGISKGKLTARLFAYQVRARRLPEPRWKENGGEVRFMGDQIVARQSKKLKRADRAPGWSFDFAWPDYRVAVEIEGLVVFQGADGNTQTGGRHANIQGFKDDCEKYAWAAVNGWRVMRFEQSQVKSGFAVDMLVRLFAAIDLGASEAVMHTLRAVVEDVQPFPVFPTEAEGARADAEAQRLMRQFERPTRPMNPPQLSLHDQAEQLFSDLWGPSLVTETDFPKGTDER